MLGALELRTSACNILIPTSAISNMSQRGGAAGGPKVKRVMTQAINLIFEFLKNVSNVLLFSLQHTILINLLLLQRERVQIWLYENVALKMEGIIIVRSLSILNGIIK